MRGSSTAATRSRRASSRTTTARRCGVEGGVGGGRAVRGGSGRRGVDVRVRGGGEADCSSPRSRETLVTTATRIGRGGSALVDRRARNGGDVNVGRRARGFAFAPPRRRRASSPSAADGVEQTHRRQLGSPAACAGRLEKRVSGVAESVVGERVGGVLSGNHAWKHCWFVLFTPFHSIRFHCRKHCWSVHLYAFARAAAPRATCVSCLVFR